MNSDLINRLWSQRAQWLRWLKATARDSVDSEDLLQDIFYELILANRGARQIENMSRWIVRVAKNRIIDASRRREREIAHSRHDIPPSDIPSSDPESTYTSAQADEDIRAALMKLPEAQRAVFIAHELGGETFASIAERTGESQNTLLARKYYAVRKLRSLLGSVYFDNTEDEDKNS